MDFKDYLNKKPKKTFKADTPSRSISNITEDEEMTQSQFKMLINELQLLRQDINKMNEGVVKGQPSPQQTMFQQPTHIQEYQQHQHAPTMQKDHNGFSVGGSAKEIAARAASILS